VETASERTAPPPGLPAASLDEELDQLVSPVVARPSAERIAAELRRLRWVLLAYAGTRALLIAVALVNGALRHHALDTELANWDGLWYRQLANHGYPALVSHGRTTLGFFPLYPISIWLVSHAVSVTTDAAGLIVSILGGLAATLIVERLASGWWGERSGQRAAILFCLFPGSVVFSMMYSEGLLIPLAAGCVYALERRRWVLAGCLAGLATAAGPDALPLILVCAMSAGRELRRRGWHVRAARRSLLAPLLSTTGVVAFALFLWAWTGTPFASLQAQRHGWGERTDPYALAHQAASLLHEISFAHFDHPTINLNLVVGLLGVAVLVAGIVLLLRRRRRVSVEAMAWTLGIAFLATTSEFVPPNPRLLLTAFPAVVVFARYLRGRRFVLLAALNGSLLLFLSALTFVSVTLRP
jgi:Mannosyltransferase (PIG-V)